MPGALPPDRLISRVGWVVGAEQPRDVFVDRGHEQWGLIADLAGRHLDLTRARILDFGCGVGRILRPAIEDLPQAEFWGCDTDGDSIAWLQSDLGDRAHIGRSTPSPPLSLPDQRFDVIYAFSVFTHLTHSWSAWLLELHRLLAPGGILVATVVGPGLTSHAAEPVSEELIGMNTLYPAASWDTGGPLVLHSEWWLRAHWGRAFDVLELRPGEQSGAPPLYGQGLLVLRRADVSLTVAELESPEPDEPREFAALQQNRQSLEREVARHAAIYTTRSWKLTAPLRAAANWARTRTRSS